MSPCPFGRGNVDLSSQTLIAAEKYWLIEQMMTNKSGPSALSTKYNLNYNTLKDWLRKARNGRKIRSDNGRPRIIPKKVLKEVKKEVQSGRYQKTLKAIDDIFDDTMRDEAELDGIAPETLNTMSKSTRSRVEKELGLVTKKAERTTTARANATASLRNAVTYAALCQWTKEKMIVPEPKLLNADGTCFTVGLASNNEDLVEIKSIAKDHYDDEADFEMAKEKINQVVNNKDEPTFGLYTIKGYFMINAYGNIFDPIYIIQDDDMDEDEMHRYVVNGLGVNAGLDSKAHLVFLKSRAGNAAFYKWVYTEYLVDINNAINTFYEDLKGRPLLLKIDGGSVYCKITNSPRVIRCDW